MARSAALTPQARRFAVNGRLAIGNGQWTVVWDLHLTGEEIRNTIASGAYLGFVCATCNDEAGRCPELRQFLPADMVAAAADFQDEETPAVAAQDANPGSRHECPQCGNAMWSGGFSFDDTVSCGTCGNREKRQAGKNYAPSQAAALVA
nr:hypothetical protein OH837_48880 [Streptomyces canus]